MDLFAKCATFTDAREAQAMGLYPYFIPLTESEGPVAWVGNHRLIMIGSNNYLGLTMHPKVRQAALDAIQRFGTSCTGSRFLNGTLEFHLELERRLARFVGKEAALVFSTGYQTNVGTISALVGRGDFVITDKEDHASIIDGCRLSYGEMRRFAHNDVDALERVLARLPEEAGKLVVVDGVFSMGGDIAPPPRPHPGLPQVRRAAHGGRCPLHWRPGRRAGDGRLLRRYRPGGPHHGHLQQVLRQPGRLHRRRRRRHPLHPALRPLPHLQRQHPPPANAAAALAALEIMETEPEHSRRVVAIGERMRAEFRRLGFNIGNSQTPIVPIIIGDRNLTLLAWKMLFDAGVYTNPVFSPAVPEGQELLRTSYMATHTDEHLEFVLEAFERVGKTLGIIQ